MSTRAPESSESASRTRDPARKERILEAAAELVARNGFHSVSMAEIGNQAGITGSGIYRHFESKSAILVALFDRTIDDLLADEAATMEANQDLDETLERLIAAQVEFVVRDRALAQVYHNEIRNLPDEDRVRLRRKQRRYVEEWVHVVREIHGGLDDATARALVHAAISAIQSSLFHNVGLPEERQRDILARAAKAVLAPGPHA
ncbi:MAG: TetR/AcrR family transcriptional regulator [Actinomycetota bacterium]|nr:TetR/AcrR family transcriptional regulator [Actinomycetota bacterium]